MIAKLKDIYTHLPDWLKRGVRIIPFKYRMGSTFRATLRMIEASDRMSEVEVRHLQEDRLAGILDTAIKTVPAYEKYRGLLGKSPFDMLREIEPVTKAQLQSDFDLYISSNRDSVPHHETFTGGSSGMPLRFIQNDSALEIEWAFMIAQWMRAGFRPGDKRVAFRGVEFRENRDSLMMENPVYDEILLSPFNLTEESLNLYVDAITRFQPRFLRGYPSAISTLARFIDENPDRQVHGTRAVLCGSEAVLDWQRELIERVFRCRLYSWYGMTEKVVMAGECEKSQRYHAFPQYGITEVVDSKGNVISEPGASGEIVGTGFTNTVMPFIRYRLDDTATIEDIRCNKCGRNHMTLGEVTGHRVQDAFVGKSGSQITMTALNMHDDTFSGVRQFQFRQSKPGEVKLLLRVTASFGSEQRNLILKSLQKKTGKDIEYDVELVDTIETTDMGKGVYLKQEIQSDR